jgi:alpha-beta hydrolase superfamily lysophospholipase
VAALWRLIAGPDPYRASVISGAPLVPIAGLLDADSSFDLEPSWLSADPFYLDSMENDPLAFVDADGVSLARELDRAWDRFGADLPTLKVPTLAVHGSDDPIADVGAVRAYAEQIEPLRLEEIGGGRHDILNDVTHQMVSDTIIEFVLGVASS